MSHQPDPLLMLAKLGQRWLIAAVVVFVLLNPVTWGIVIGVYNFLSGDMFVP